jgi:hypothetical protein
MSPWDARTAAIVRNVELGREAAEEARLRERIARLEAQIRALGHEPAP